MGKNLIILSKINHEQQDFISKPQLNGWSYQTDNYFKRLPDYWKFRSRYCLINNTPEITSKYDNIIVLQYTTNQSIPGNYNKYLRKAYDKIRNLDEDTFNKRYDLTNTEFPFKFLDQPEAEQYIEELSIDFNKFKYSFLSNIPDDELEISAMFNDIFNKYATLEKSGMVNDTHFIVNKDYTKVSIRYSLEAAKFGTTFNYINEYSGKNKLIEDDTHANFAHLLSCKSVNSISSISLPDLREKADKLGIFPPKDVTYELRYFIAAISIYYGKGILVTGETGVGKNYFINMVLDSLKVVQDKIITINVSNDSNLFETNFFGHKKGTFTDAMYERAGYLESFRNGFIILDEVGDIPIASQPKFLQFLQDGKYIKLGTDVQSKSNAKFIFATNRDLNEMVKKGSFRKDLYYRINQEEITLEPFSELALKTRNAIIDNLVDTINKELADKSNNNNLAALSPTLWDDIELSPEAKEIISTLYWPGNIRQLKQSLENIFIKSSAKILTGNELNKYIILKNEELIIDCPEDKLQQAKLEYRKKMKEIIEDALEKYDTKKEAAEMLGFNSTQTMLNRINTLNKTLK
ncbi:MAG: sigma 54-interacting transcriptional regulator [Candidatus Stygibacter australis]|nr:sigma 54-interacting transcriptional regulator [Candidatus Stygibacter australis]MDP8320874.1 sigma 54-interacting transcriptional regulator [Candidatus Stygibacter australis]